jgi:hypothetical protein
MNVIALFKRMYSAVWIPSTRGGGEHGLTFATWHALRSSSCPKVIALRSFRRKLGFSAIAKLVMKYLVHYR